MPFNLLSGQTILAANHLQLDTGAFPRLDGVSPVIQPVFPNRVMDQVFRIRELQDQHPRHRIRFLAFIGNQLPKAENGRIHRDRVVGGKRNLVDTPNRKQRNQH